MQNPKEVRDRQSKNVKKESQADIIFQTVSEMVEDRKVAPEQIDQYIEGQLKAGHGKDLKKAEEMIGKRLAECVRTVNQFADSVSDDHSVFSCGKKIVERDAAFLEKLGKHLLALQLDCRARAMGEDDREGMDTLWRDVKSILGIYRVELDHLSAANPDLKDWCAKRQAKLEEIEDSFGQSCGVPKSIDSKTGKAWLNGMWAVYRALQKRSSISGKFAANKDAVRAVMRDEFWMYEKLCDMAGDEKVTALQIFDYLNDRGLFGGADAVDKARSKMDHKRTKYDQLVRHLEDSLRGSSEPASWGSILLDRDQALLKGMEKKLLLLQIDRCKIAIKDEDMEQLKEDMKLMLKAYHSELNHLSAANPSLKGWCEEQRNKLKEIEDYFNKYSDSMARGVSILPWFDDMGKVYRDLKACSSITKNLIDNPNALNSFVKQEFHPKNVGNKKPFFFGNDDSMMSQFSDGKNPHISCKSKKK